MIQKMRQIADDRDRQEEAHSKISGRPDKLLFGFSFHKLNVNFKLRN